MGDLHAGIIKNFGIKPGKQKKEKSYFIYDQPEGTQKLYKTNATPERIQFEHSIKEHLIQAGFPWVDRYNLSVTGQPYVQSGGENYVMTPYIRGRDTDFENWADFSRVLETTAGFHRCARGVSLPFPHNAGIPLTEYYQRQFADLSSTAKRVRRQPRLSDFDVLFIKNLPFYTEQIKNAIHCLHQSDYLSRRETALSQGHICHNALKEETVYVCLKSGEPAQTFITDFTEASFRHCSADLAGLILRHVKRTASPAPLSEIIAVYSETNALTRGDLAALRAELTFPDAYIKLCRKYYAKKRTWIPGAFLGRMETLGVLKDKYKKYIDCYEW
jgi:spore coat protein I